MSADFPSNVSVGIPKQHDFVFKEECIFSHDTPLSEDGLYVCLEKFVGFGRQHVMQFHQRTGNRIFLHIKRTKTKRPKEFDVPAKVSKMAIGVDGGFAIKQDVFDYSDTYKVVLLPEFKEFNIDASEVPLAVQMSAKGVIQAESALKRLQLECEAGSWEGEPLLPSKFADNLEQLSNGKKIPPKGWKCEKCDLTNNLWLNLTDGAILCGRKFFDGSGGNNHAIDYYNEKKYPLAVKLGTITADGKADVFSYPEDNMVLDPHLKKHLAHFGINMAILEKTDKSMAELEIDLNKNWEFSAITEAGETLELAYGKGFTGLENLGNTCYMNSIMQLLFNLPPFITTYVDQAPNVFAKANFNDPLNDFKLQMCKLGHSIWSGKYSNPPTEEEIRLAKEGQSDDDKKPDIPQEGIRPQSFKMMVGKGHPEFSTNRQQDAQEFFLHLFSLMEKCHVNDYNPMKSFQFKVEDRIMCGQSKKVKYVTRVEDYLPLPVQVALACNPEEVAVFEQRKKEAEAKGERIPEGEVVRPKIKFETCLEKFLCEEIVDDFTSPVTNQKTFAQKTNRLATFPEFLMVQLKKFDLDANWTPYKLDVEVEMPATLNLESLRGGGGLQPGEEEMPMSDEAKSAPAEVTADEAIVSQLVAMGFDRNGCVKAAVNTKNSGLEPAVAWVMDHMGDADFADPLPAPKAAGSSFVPNAEGLAMLMSMGMPEKKCIKALKETDNNVERAVDWIFSHPDDDGSDLNEGQSSSSAASGDDLTDGNPNYKLMGIISHIGTSVHVGHYVCHILKDDGNWYIFNDSKVAKSKKPPMNLGYLYCYKRI